MSSKGREADDARTQQFIQLLMASRRRLYGLAITLVPHAADADDLLQEASTRMWQKFHAFTPGTEFVAWGYEFVRYAALDFHKKRRWGGGVAFSDSLINELADRVAAEGAETNRRQEALQACLDQLPHASRRLIELRYEHGGSCGTVAARVGKSVHTVYKQLGRIHDALLNCVQRRLAEVSG